jgi:hypothetical protein
MKMKWFPSRRRMIVWLVVILAPSITISSCIISMPDRRSETPLAELTAGSSPEKRARLKAHVRMLAETIGRRPALNAKKIGAARTYIHDEWVALGYYVRAQEYTLTGRPNVVANLELLLPGSDRTLPTLVIGAHYDTVPTTPGADDNASGVALLLELARDFQGVTLARDLRLVAFVCEEPEFFQTEDMGSLRYARDLRAHGVEVGAMVSLESLGYYRDEPDSQQYPGPIGLFYPDRGRFVGVVSDLSSRALTRKTAEALIAAGKFPVESASLPGWIPGVGWSDHWSFWQVGFPAVMLTDTAPFRNGEYHEAGDTVDTLDYAMLAAISEALPAVVRKLAE